jgi:decaprenyl-phosphate phosphoribosyltransferase
MSHDIIMKFNTDHLYLTSVFVILGMMRYLQVTLVEQRSGAPSDIVLRDHFIQISIVGWIMTFWFLVYFHYHWY